MTLLHLNLDDRTRRLMLDELERDLELGSLFLGSELTEAGRRDYEALLREAIVAGDAASLAEALERGGRLRAPDQAVGSPEKDVGPAARALAESEFNRFYMRALCLRALEERAVPLLIYRARRIGDSPPAEQALIGTSVEPASLLDALRTRIGSGPVPGLAEPTSGLSVRLP